MDSMPPIADLTCAGLAVPQLHWLASGRVQPQRTEPKSICDAIAQAQSATQCLCRRARRPGADRHDAAERRRRDGVIGRLDGIPMAFKDNFDIAGCRPRRGLAGSRTRVAQHDAHVVARLRAAGAVLIGKTNMDEGALGAATDNPHFGATHNPHRHGYSAGGSSGGSAAAVAAGLAVAAIGSDTLGSVRIPASYCGVCALKPTHGEISARGLVPAARRLDAVGVLAREVGDLSVLLQVLAGYDADDPRSRRRRVALRCRTGSRAPCARACCRILPRSACSRK